MIINFWLSNIPTEDEQIFVPKIAQKTNKDDYSTYTLLLFVFYNSHYNVLCICSYGYILLCSYTYINSYVANLLTINYLYIIASYVSLRQNNSHDNKRPKIYATQEIAKSVRISICGCIIILYYMLVYH